MHQDFCSKKGERCILGWGSEGWNIAERAYAEGYTEPLPMTRDLPYRIITGNIIRVALMLTNLNEISSERVEPNHSIQKTMWRDGSIMLQRPAENENLNERVGDALRITMANKQVLKSSDQEAESLLKVIWSQKMKKRL